MNTAKGMASIANPIMGGAAPTEDANWLKALSTLAENGDKIGNLVDGVGSAVSNMIDVVKTKKKVTKQIAAQDDLSADVAKKKYAWEDEEAEEEESDDETD